MKEIYRYVIQNHEGKFYWKNSSTSSCHGFDSNFDKAFFFKNVKSALTRIKTLNVQNCIIKKVICTLI
jgi:hypothetical protein